MTAPDRPSAEYTLVGLVLHQGPGRLAELRRAVAGTSEALWVEGLIERANFPRLTEAQRDLVRGAVALMALAQTGAGRGAAGHGSVGARLGELWRDQGQRPSTELRFLTLTDADVDGALHHLRQVVTLLGPDRQPNWPEVLRDLLTWPDPDRRRRTVRRWARDFYRTGNDDTEDLSVDGTEE